MPDPSSPQPPVTRAAGFGGTGHEFGKRRPEPPTPSQPPSKRSRHVVLLVMGTLAVGGTAYAMMPHRQTCPQPAPGVVTPGQTPAATDCAPRSSSGGSSGGGYGGVRWGLFDGTSSSRWSSSSGGTESSFAGGVSRGGFGGAGHAAGASSGS